jgi:hypothetical protein
MGWDRNSYKVLEVKPEGNSPHERPGRRGVVNIRLDIEVKGWVR